MLDTILFLLLIPARSETKDNYKCYNDTILDEGPFCVMEDYDKDIIPSEDDAMNVTVVAEIEDIIQVDDIAKSVTFSMLLGTSWYDHRLQINQSSRAWTVSESGPNGNISYVCPNTNVWDFLWMPVLLHC